jgi:hypothetical protein
MPRHSRVYKVYFTNRTYTGARAGLQLSPAFRSLHERGTPTAHRDLRGETQAHFRTMDPERFMLRLKDSCRLARVTRCD